ncbi:MAG: hypothetical protein CVU63_21725, partial [Deltaproteobacteria bacterium HGW-Deltaproteobacteria-20]
MSAYIRPLVRTGLVRSLPHCCSDPTIIPTPMAQRRTHVLLVDDDVLLCRGLSRTLALHEFEVSTANTAAEALSCIGSNSVDIILLDWILPDRDGVTLLQDLRERGVVAPVIMLSGECSVQGRVRALNRGADD